MSQRSGFFSTYLRAAASLAWRFSFGSLTRSGRAGVYQVHETLFGRRALPTIDIFKSTPDDVQISLRAVAAADGNVTPFELLAIATLVRTSAPRRIFEIGTFDGRTTLNMALAAADAEIFTLDLPASAESQAALGLGEHDVKYIRKATSGARASGAKITQLYGDSARFDFSPYAGTIDLVFVDASHEYEYVKNDTDVAVRLLRGGKGTILWHDYDNSGGVTRRLHELVAAGGAFANIRRIAETNLAVLRIE